MAKKVALASAASALASSVLPLPADRGACRRQARRDLRRTRRNARPRAHG